VFNWPIAVGQQEWDGLLRVCFTRKNKTIGAAFKATTVLEMLEKNYKTYCALNNIVCLADWPMDHKTQYIGQLITRHSAPRTLLYAGFAAPKGPMHGISHAT
jgi:hypothetical protein